MQRSTTFVIMIVVLALVAITTSARTGLAQPTNRVPAAEKSDSSPQREAQDFSVIAQQLVAEMKKLRLEVLELRLENLGLQRAQWEREVERVRSEQHDVQEQESKLRQGIAALDRRLGLTITEEADRAELEATKKSLLENQVPRVQAELQKISLRETELMKQLTEAEQRRQETLARMRMLK